MKKICFVVTVSMTVDQFIRFSFEKLHSENFDITVIADMDSQYMHTLPSYIHAVSIPMKRGIDIHGMMKSVLKMFRLFRKEKYDIVQYSTPNGSLYASIAAFLTRVPIRLYCQWGLVYLSFDGFKRVFFRTIEKIVCRLSTDIQPDSPGNLKLCRKIGYYDEKKSCVIWNGSASGVDLEKFDISRKKEYRQLIREQYGISQDVCVLGYIGRVGKEKGFEELMSMMQNITRKYQHVILLYVGPNEKPETVKKEYLEYFDTCKKIVYTGGWVDDTEKYYAAMDVMIFPTYHEGFGNVSIEAASMGIPVVASNVPGPQDAIIDGKTGYLVPAKDVDALTERVELLMNDSVLRETMGKNGRKYVEDCFDSRVLLDKIIENRNLLIDQVRKCHRGNCMYR